MTTRISDQFQLPQIKTPIKTVFQHNYELSKLLQNSGLIEEIHGTLIFTDKENGSLVKFTEPDREEKLENYLQQIMPQKQKTSTFATMAMGIIGITMLGSFIASTFNALNKLRAHFNLASTTSLALSGLCVVNKQNRGVCVALPMLSHLGKALADIIVAHPIPNQTAYPGQDFALNLNSTSVFHQTTSSLPLVFSAKQANGAPLPSWLKLKLEPTLVGSIASSNAYAMGVYAVNNTAYVANYANGLVLVSVANPAKPSLLGSLATAEAYDVYVQGSAAYIANGDLGLEIASVANPAQPSFLGSVTSNSEALDVFVTEDVAYIADWYSGLKIISVANPSKPTFLGSLAISEARAISVAGNKAFIADWETGLKIVSVTNSTQPVLLGSFTTSEAHGVYATNDIAYVADYDEGLEIISVSDPANCHLLGSLYIQDSSQDVFVNGNVAYLTIYDAGLFTISVADSAHPSLLGSFGTTHAMSLYVLDNVAYVGGYSGDLKIISIANPSKPSLLGSFTVISPPLMSVYVVGTTAYVGNGNLLEIRSVANPTNCSLLGTLSTVSSVQNVYVTNNVAYIADYTAGLQMVAVTNPTQPSSLGAIASSDNAQRVYVNGDQAYIANGLSGLQVVSIANPANPTVAGSLATVSALDIVVENNIAYVADDSAGLKIISVENPTQPILLGTLPIQNAQRLSVVGDKAYVTDAAGVLQIVSVGDSAHPSLLGSLSASSYGIHVVGNIAYTVGGELLNNGFLQIISVADPSRPSLVGSLHSLYYPQDIHVINHTAYIADTLAGLKVVDCSTWQFTGATPIPEFGKVYNITLTAQNSLGEKGITSFLLEVYNEGPHVATPIPNQVIHIGHDLNFAVPSKTFSDPYGDVLKYSSTLVGGEALPNWLTFNSTARKFSGMPLQETDIKDWQVEVKAADPYQKSAATDFTLSALHLGPTVGTHLDNHTIDVGHPFVFVVPETTFLNQDSVTLSYSSRLINNGPLPTWLSFNSLTKTFNGTTQSKADIRNSNIAVRVDDAYGKHAETNFYLSIYENGIKVTGTIPDQQVFANVYFEYIFPSVFLDEDNLPLHYRALLLNGNPLPLWLNLDSDHRKFSGTASDLDIGIHQIRLYGGDNYAEKYVDFEMIVYPFHYQSPSVDKGIRDRKASVGRYFSYKIPDNAFTNPTSDHLTYNAFLTGGNSLPNWLSFAPDSKTFSGSPNGEGTLSITVTVTDSYKASAQTSFALTSINRTLQILKTFANIGGPTISALGFLITAYVNRAAIRNHFKKKDYQLHDETITIGKPWHHTITKVDAYHIKAIKVLVQYTAENLSFSERVINWWNDSFVELPNQKSMPVWLEHDDTTNELQNVPSKMTAKHAGLYTVIVLNKNGYKKEEFLLHVQEDGAPAEPPKSNPPRDIEMGSSMTEPLLQAHE